MAFKNAAHRLEVFQTEEYRRAITLYIAAGTPVPLAVFQDAYGKAFFNARGKPEKPGRTATSRTAFLNLLKWQDRLPEEVETWDDWLEYNDY